MEFIKTVKLSLDEEEKDEATHRLFESLNQFDIEVK